MRRIQDIARNPRLRRIRQFIQKVGKDNVGVLAAVLAWNTLTSLVPIVVGLIAISGLILQGDPSTQHGLVVHLSAVFKGVLTAKDLTHIVKTTVTHSGLFGLIGFGGVLWGGSNVGGAISTIFQAVFETGGRNFFKEKLLDIGMIFVLTILMVVIVLVTTMAALIHNLIANFPLSGAASFAIGVVISVVAGFILFSAVYVAFPNTKPRLKIRHVWVGALIAAALFELLTFVWPIYAHFSHFSKYGAVLVPLLVLTAWVYFFALILVLGSEFVAMGAILESNKEEVPIGPEPQNIVPQHRVLRDK